MKFKIFKLKRVTSTNDVAMKLIQKEKKRNRFCIRRNTNKRKRVTRKIMGIRKRKFFWNNFFSTEKKLSNV